MHGALGRATTVGQAEKQPVVRWAGPRLFLVFTVALLCFPAFGRPLALGGLPKRDLRLASCSLNLGWSTSHLKAMVVAVIGCHRTSHVPLGTVLSNVATSLRHGFYCPPFLGYS